MSDDAAAPELRASDAEREQTVELLRHAVAEGRLDVDELDDRLQSAYTVATRSELQQLIADVSTGSIVPRGSLTTHPARVVSPGEGGTRRLVSIMSGHDRRGRWRVAPALSVVNVMGGSELDLNDAELSAQETTIRVVSVMGGGEIRVPDGVDVQVSQFAFMGGNEIELGDELPPPGAPVIYIRLVSVMGGVSVHRGRKKSKLERKLARAQRKLDRHLGPGAVDITGMIGTGTAEGQRELDQPSSEPDSAQ
jgi:hypothetical protein